MTLVLLAACAEPGPAGAPTPPATGLHAHGPEGVTDTFFVDASPVVDLVVAVDPALEPEVAEDLPSLLDALRSTGADWRLGLVSTSLGDPATDGRIAAVLDASDPAPGTGELADTGVHGALGAIRLALDPAVNPGFLRAGSAVHALAVQAEDDATPAALVTPAGFEAWFAALRPVPDRSFSAIAPDDADVLRAVAADLGGIVADIADPLAPALAEVGVHSSGVDSVFPLSAWPDDTTLLVRVTSDAGAELAFQRDDDWTWDPVANAIRFVEFVPSPGTRVRVSYLPR